MKLKADLIRSLDSARQANAKLFLKNKDLQRHLAEATKANRQWFNNSLEQKLTIESQHMLIRFYSNRLRTPDKRDIETALQKWAKDIQDPPLTNMLGDDWLRNLGPIA